MTQYELHYYTIAWLEIIEGGKISDLNAAIRMYLSIEDYEACAGIQVAINEYIYYLNMKKKLLK